MIVLIFFAEIEITVSQYHNRRQESKWKWIDKLHYFFPSRTKKIIFEPQYLNQNQKSTSNFTFKSNYKIIFELDNKKSYQVVENIWKKTRIFSKFLVKNLKSNKCANFKVKYSRIFDLKLGSFERKIFETENDFVTFVIWTVQRNIQKNILGCPSYKVKN